VFASSFLHSRLIIFSQGQSFEIKKARMKRPLQVVVCVGVAILQNAEAMVATSRSRTNIIPVGASKAMPSLQTTTRSRPSNDPVGTRYEEDDEDNEDIEFEVNAFQELQRSTGTEVLDDELQLQIDQASKYPDLFLDAHVSDASYFEKVAMSNVPEQLPRPAVKALRKSHGLNYGKDRVSPEEEIELAKMIQNGVKLHRLRSDFEEKEGRKLNRLEWTKVAGLESANELRRQVALYRRAKQLLVSANIGLVHAIVKTKYSRSFSKSGLSFEEIVQEGSLGLLRAAELFDPSRGLRFSTYATIWIKGSLSNSHVVETVKLPQREKTKWNKIVRAHEELAQEHGGDEEPTVEEVANHLGMTVSEILATKRKMKQVKQVLSLDYESSTQTRSGIQSGKMNRLENDKAFMADADLAERTQMHADVVAAMARNLDAREARLMRLRYGLADGRPRSLSDCADAMGLSQTYVQNIAQRCLKKLREASEAESLEEYLLTIA
jgi:RNA polymerase primary sigma factor